jgi:hypothetical protein
MMLSEFNYRPFYFTCLLILALFSIVACQSNDDPDNGNTLDLAGVLDSVVTIPHETTVYVSDDLQFMDDRDTSTLIFEGDATFLIDQNVKIELPSRISVNDENTIKFRSSGSEYWGRITINSLADSIYIKNFDIKNAANGFVINGSESVSRYYFISNLVIRDCAMFGLVLNRISNGYLNDSSISNCEVGISNELSTFALGSCTISGHREGIRNTASNLTLTDCIISDCTYTGIISIEQSNTDVSYTRFDNNYYAIVDKTNRHVTYQFNEFVNQNYYPISFTRVWANYVSFENNNIYPGTNGRYVVLSEGTDQEGSGYFPCANNYWGTTDTTDIVDGIFDSRNFINRGYIDFDPILSSRVQNTGPR